MSDVLRAESRKVLATPTIWWLLLATVGIGVLGTVVPLIAVDDGTDLLTDRSLQQAMHGAAAGATLVLVAGVIGTAGEWRFGRATSTFLAEPVRRRVVAAKALVYLGVGAAFGVAAGVGSAGAAWAWYRADGLALPLDRSAVWLTLLGCLAVSVLFGPLGVAVGAIVRNQVGAIVAVLTWLVIVEPALFAAAPSVFRWLPGTASFALRRQPAADLLSPGTAAIELVVVLVVLLVLGTWFVERDDVTT